jgi:hypothetical protein
MSFLVYCSKNNIFDYPWTNSSFSLKDPLYTLVRQGEIIFPMSRRLFVMKIFVSSLSKRDARADNYHFSKIQHFTPNYLFCCYIPLYLTKQWPAWRRQEFSLPKLMSFIRSIDIIITTVDRKLIDKGKTMDTYRKNSPTVFIESRDTFLPSVMLLSSCCEHFSNLRFLSVFEFRASFKCRHVESPY